MNIIEKLDNKYSNMAGGKRPGSSRFLQIYAADMKYEDKQQAIVDYYPVSRYTAKNWIRDMRKMRG